MEKDTGKIKRAILSDYLGFEISAVEDFHTINCRHDVYVDTENEFLDFLENSVSTDVDSDISYLSEFGDDSGISILRKISFEDYIDTWKIKKDIIDGGYADYFIESRKVKITEINGAKFYITNYSGIDY